MKIEDKSKTKSGTVCFLYENESCGYWTGRCEVPRFPLRSILHVKSELKMNKFFTPRKCETRILLRIKMAQYIFFVSEGF